MLSLDVVVALITLLEGLALVWLCVPLRRLPLFCQQQLILVLLPPFWLIIQATNAARIALLAQIVSLGAKPGTRGGGWWFDFFHEEMGSLIFSGIACFCSVPSISG